MAVETKKIAGRRSIRYESYDDLLEEAQRLAGGQVDTLGNWSYAQILEHLGTSLDSAIDGVPFSVPFPMRIVGKLFMKSKFLNKTLPPGFKIPKSGEDRFIPQDSVSVQEGLDHLQQAVERCKTASSFADHALFGRMTPEEWQRFNLRHAELHMSFAVPANEGG